MDDSSSPSCSACGSWWRLPLLLGLVLAAIVLAKGRGIRQPTTESAGPVPPERAGDGAAAAVSLTIDYGDGRRQIEALKWYEGMTVRDLLDAARGVSISQQGSGAAAFLTQIGGVANEGADGRNWTYTVNGQRGDRSFAMCELRPADQVLWTFAQ